MSRITGLFGHPYFCLSKHLKKSTKKVAQFIRDFEADLLKYAQSKGCDGVIFGHTHSPKLQLTPFVGNCGSWIDDGAGTALIEYEDGKWELVTI